jgi:hypothetical protein
MPTAPTPVSTVAPALTGVPAPGQTLTCSTGSWANNPSSFAFAWLRDGAPIVGQSGNTYVVQAADRGHSISCQVTASNSGGEYTIVGLPSGSYKVEFFPAFESNLNYLLQYYNGQPSATTATPVSVVAPSLAGGINAGMQTGGQIAGRVTAAGGGPLANVTVCASRSESFGGCATTNGAGEYTIVGLSSGSYTVEFFAGSFFVEGGAGNYARQFYNGKSSAGEANAVAVTAGSTTPGINAELHEGGQITGRVTAAGAGPLENVVACAFSEAEFEIRCALTNSAGEYAVGGLSSGEYKVAFLVGVFESSNANYLNQFYNHKELFSEAETVSVTVGTTTPNIDAELHEGGRVAGTATDASSHAPLAGIEVCGGFKCATTNALGEYVLTGVATGTYSVEFSPTENSNYLPQTVSGVKVTAGSTTSPVNAEMQHGGQIAGTVTDASSHVPLVKVRVCVIGAFRCASTNTAGQYTVTALTTGTYSVEFVPPEGANDLPQSIAGVNVTTGSTTAGVDAALAAGGQISGRVTAASNGVGLANIEACAQGVGGSEAFRCALTNAAGSAAVAASNALAVPEPTSAFKQVRKPVFDAKSGNLVFFFQVSNPGKFTWSLSFRNSDVGFADALGISLGEGGPTAGAAKRCKKGYLKHRGRCVRKLVPFSSGSQSVAAGVVTVKAHASAKAIKALKAGRTLHVSGKFTFQSALGGSPATRAESAVVRLPKRHHKKHGRK